MDRMSAYERVMGGKLGNSGTLLTGLTFLTLNFFHILFWQLSAKMCSFITCPLMDDRFFNNFIFFNYLK